MVQTSNQQFNIHKVLAKIYLALLQGCQNVPIRRHRAALRVEPISNLNQRMELFFFPRSREATAEIADSAWSIVAVKLYNHWHHRPKKTSRKTPPLFPQISIMTRLHFKSNSLLQTEPSRLKELASGWTMQR